MFKSSIDDLALLILCVSLSTLCLPFVPNVVNEEVTFFIAEDSLSMPLFVLPDVDCTSCPAFCMASSSSCALFLPTTPKEFISLFALPSEFSNALLSPDITTSIFLSLSATTFTSS